MPKKQAKEGDLKFVKLAPDVHRSLLDYCKKNSRDGARYILWRVIDGVIREGMKAKNIPIHP